MTYQIISERRLKYTETLNNPVNVFELLKRYGSCQQEQFIVLTVNSMLKPLSVSITHIGTVDRILVHPREIFIKAIADKAIGIIVAHNHPSGNLCPSDEDLRLTKNIIKCGLIIGIKLIDHIIFSKNGYYSMKEENKFPKIREESENQLICRD